MPAYQTPGVYYERVDANVGGISAIRTDVAGFVGIAERGPVDIPVPVESWRQFQAYFGDFNGKGFLAYAVRGFFENGGRRCWVVRVASKDPNGGADYAGTIIKCQSGENAWRIRAFSSGVWGNQLSVQLKPTSRAQTRIPPLSQTNPQLEKNNNNASSVDSVSGFERGTLVRLTQGAHQAWRVVSAVDAMENRLIWVNSDARAALPYERELKDFVTDESIFVESLEYTLVIRASGRPAALYEGLSLIPEHSGYGPARLAPIDFLNINEMRRTLPSAPPVVVIEELRVPFFSNYSFQQRRLYLQAKPLDSWVPLSISVDDDLRLSDGTDGLAILSYKDFVGEERTPWDNDETKKLKERGVRALENVGEVSMIAVPDIHIRPYPTPAKSPRPVCIPDPCLPRDPNPAAELRIAVREELPPIFSEDEIYQVQAAMVQQCETLRDRIAVLDPPYSAARDDDLGIGAIRSWRNRFDSKYAALYYPWLRVVDPLRSTTALTRDIPPSGHTLGCYAGTDIETGVHKAPANNPLSWLQDLSVDINESQHGLLNDEGINVIRVFPGRGIRIFGARTVSSDPDWRYVNVRRLILMIEKAIDHSTQWAVFEPNDVYTRNKLRLSISSFLISLWQQGALTGATMDQAFFVKSDEENNPPTERENGRLLVDVGVAPAKPFEFIVLRVGRSGNAFEIVELSN